MNKQDVLEKIKAEIDQVLDMPSDIQETDLTIKDMMQLYGISRSTAMRAMIKVAEKSKDFTLIRVRSIEPYGRLIYVLRRSKI